MASVRPAGRDVQLFNDEIFRQVRAFAQVPDDFVNEGWDLGKLQNGGGKGGTLMARVGACYIVKELSKGDHETLLQIAGGYADHVRDPDTILCPIYLHFRDKTTGRFFFAMRNAIGSGPFVSLYDLKGCADDKLIEKAGEPVKPVHKRVWNVGMWLGKSTWSPERRAYFAGKVEARNISIYLTEDQRARCLRCIERDTKWLAENRLMDYSLLVAIKDVPSENTASGGRGPSNVGPSRYVYRGPDGRDVAVHITIIDYLQKWTMGKRVARVIKFAECNKATIPPVLYGRRFARHFKQHLVALPGSACAEANADGDTEGAPRKPANSIAPPAGDCCAEGQPEERLNSRPIPDEGGRPVIFTRA